MHSKLVPPCSYQGGKQRLAKQIVDIILEQNNITEYTKFYDLCCGCGAITLELINRGIHPTNIIMVDKGLFGKFWNSIANNEFNLDVFQQEIKKIPEKEYIKDYLQNLSNKKVNFELLEYHYLLLQSGSFGSKQIYIEEDKWKNNSFRNYWLPTENSNRRSPVNPMMPMPDTLFNRVKNIVDNLSGVINAIYSDVKDIEIKENAIIYIDPPYKNTESYNDDFDYENFIYNNKKNNIIYLSEGYALEDAKSSILLSKSRLKGNISGNIKRKPTEEWLNIFNF